MPAKIIYTSLPPRSIADLAFGRDIERYWILIAFLAAVSIFLWTFVFFTAVLRLTYRYLWNRQRRRGASEAGNNAER